MSDTIANSIAETAATLSQLARDTDVLQSVGEAAELWVETLKAGNCIYFAGNGGSAGDSQHLAGELVSRFYFDRPGLAGIALTVDTSILTAIGNDYGYDYVFRRQLEALAKPGDLFVAISTSGNSGNIVSALEYCREAGIKSVGLTGANGGKMKDMCDLCIRIPHDSTPRIQEGHLAVGHALCEHVEEQIFADHKPG